ncbi:MAG: zinc ribbon domain-containing protein [Clostridium sp.]|nr:zinc ribbon domain-containing protein [Clostridium sp.]
MFFIGVFGIEHKEKEVKVLNNFSCRNCTNSVNGRLIKYYDYFHFFFIPLFKWNIQYYVICSSCNAEYSISKEKGRAIENNEDVKITYWDLNEINSSYNHIQRCSNCGREVESQFDYCPYCGNRIKPY